MMYSKKWVRWITMIGLGTCPECFMRNGKIYSYDDLFRIGAPLLHPNCNCKIKKLKAIIAGTATSLGVHGADWWLTYLNELPDYYISKDEAKEMGWIRWKGNLDDIAPGHMIFGGVYKNKDEILPQRDGRIWYEADINYTGGYRKGGRIVFSNDGLIFVTYDHYSTFVEIIGEE